jgi:hypothetical protein
MVDSVEHRVEMHRIGRERRAAGKGRWDQTVAIAAYIHDEYSEDKAVNAYHVMRNVADLISAKLGKFINPERPECDFDFADMIEDMRERSLESVRGELDPQEAISGYLDQVYDFFDYNNIWSGAGAEKIVKMLPLEPEADLPSP